MTGKCETPHVILDPYRLARILTRYERTDPDSLSRRMSGDEAFPIDGTRDDGMPGTFAWRFRLKAAEGIIERELKEQDNG